MRERWILWGASLSPYALKLDAMLRRSGVDFMWRPAGGGRLENLRLGWRLERLRAGRLTIDYPPMSELDELPQVPFLLSNDGRNLYDSSALATWIDERSPHTQPLVPAEPLARFVARLIDEYFDEFGLYMAHHNRWVTSARTNDAGHRLSGEFGFVWAGPQRSFGSRWFSARQVRRLPYLFSVAPQTPDFDDLPPALRPPAREGFPPTHELLDRSFLRMLERMELVLSDRPYLLGDRFTVADASAFGQLDMNLSDPTANEIIEVRAPLTHAWIRRIEDGRFEERPVPDEALELGGRLGGLLEEIGRVFVPLMRQNEAAYEREVASGAPPDSTYYNESAFDAGRALYDGEIDGTPFRAVVKTFQVAVWRGLCAQWRALDPDKRRDLPISLD